MLHICGDFGRGGYVVLPVMRARIWKWAVCWRGSSLWYGANLVKQFKTRQAAQAFWRTKSPRFTGTEDLAWITKLIEDEQ